MKSLIAALLLFVCCSASGKSIREIQDRSLRPSGYSTAAQPVYKIQQPTMAAAGPSNTAYEYTTYGMRSAKIVEGQRIEYLID